MVENISFENKEDSVKLLDISSAVCTLKLALEMDIESKEDFSDLATSFPIKNHFKEDSCKLKLPLLMSSNDINGLCKDMTESELKDFLEKIQQQRQQVSKLFQICVEEFPSLKA